MRGKPRKPLSHRTPDRCVMCGTDSLGTAEAGEDGAICAECYLDRHDLHRLFHAGCALCWDQYRADKQLGKGDFQ